MQSLIAAAAEIAALERATQDARDAPIERLEPLIDSRSRRQCEDEQLGFERTEIRDTHGQSEGHFGEQIEKCAAGRRLTNPFLGLPGCRIPTSTPQSNRASVVRDRK